MSGQLAPTAPGGRQRSVAALTLVAVAASLLVGLAGPVAAQQTPDDSCELRSDDYDASECFEYQVSQECGALDVQFTENGSPYAFGFVYTESEIDPNDYSGDGGFPATWPEDYNDGEVEVTFYAVGPEADYFAGSSIPNWWELTGETVTVDTDCETPPPPPPTLPTTTTTLPAGTETVEPTVPDSAPTTEPADVGGITDEPDSTDEGGVGGAGGGGTLPRTGAGAGAALLVAGLALGLGATLRSASRRLS